MLYCLVGETLASTLLLSALLSIVLHVNVLLLPLGLSAVSDAHTQRELADGCCDGRSQSGFRSQDYIRIIRPIHGRVLFYSFLVLTDSGD